MKSVPRTPRRQVKISQLRRELDSITKERDEKIKALLTPEQNKKIDDLKAAAKQPKEKKPAKAKAESKAAAEPKT